MTSPSSCFSYLKKVKREAFSFLKFEEDFEEESGFTLIELLISIAIFILLSAAMVLQYGTTDDSERLNAAENQILTTIKDTRNSSVAIEEYGEAGSGIFPSYGVGFKENSSEITVYADCKVDDDDNGTLDDRDSFIYDPSSENCASGNEDGLVEVVTLPEGTQVSAIETFESSTQTPDEVYIEYIRPLPSVWISDGSADPLAFGRVEIEITAARTNDTRKVIVYSSGLIESNRP